jgi:hypothetical protein
MITAVFQNSEFATTLFQVLMCIPIYLAAIPIPPETHTLFYNIPFLFLVYTIVTFPSTYAPTTAISALLQHLLRAQTTAVQLPLAALACCPSIYATS